MSRSVADFFIFLLFVYIIDGIPLGDKPDSAEVKYGISDVPDSSGLGTETFHWPRGEVPYLFDNSSYDDMLKDKLTASMKVLERESCARFKRLETRPARQASWLHVTNPGKERACSHAPRHRQNGEIQVVLGYDCLKQHEITHALLHGIGFPDEITHPKRDSYVQIMWNNIKTDYWKLFKESPLNDSRHQLEYDPKSIMQFHDHAFTSNGGATISAKVPGLKIAPSDNLSHLDKMKLGMKFGHECNKRKVAELLETCHDLLTNDSKNNQETSETLDAGEQAKDIENANEQSETNHIDQNSDEHNIIVVGHDANSQEQVKIGNSPIQTKDDSDARQERGKEDENHNEMDAENDDNENKNPNEDENGDDEDPNDDLGNVNNEDDDENKASLEINDVEPKSDLTRNRNGNDEEVNGDLSDDNNQDDRENKSRDVPNDNTNTGSTPSWLRSSVWIG